MSTNTQPTLDLLLSRINGRFVGELTDDELAVFESACQHGLARRAYSGAAGLLGLARVRVLPHGEAA